MGDLSQNFSAWEFKCQCGQVGTIDKKLLMVLEKVRALKGKPLRIVSGWRCIRHNRAVGGIRTSQHLFGRAVDVPRGYATVGEWAQAGAVGIGLRDLGVVHVDVTPNRKTFVFED